MISLNREGIVLSGKCVSTGPNTIFTRFRLEGDEGYVTMDSRLIVELFDLMYYDYSRRNPCTVEEFIDMYRKIE
jgi:hypothetical protein